MLPPPPPPAPRQQKRGLPATLKHNPSFANFYGPFSSDWFPAGTSTHLHLSLIGSFGSCSCPQVQQICSDLQMPDAVLAYAKRAIACFSSSEAGTFEACPCFTA
jgi:hypothetical protein